MLTLLLLLLPLLAHAALPNRHSTSTPCSLRGVSEEDPMEGGCRVQSTLQAAAEAADGDSASASSSSSRSSAFLAVGLGESNCTVTLDHCMKDMCYVLYDSSVKDHRGVVPGSAAAPPVFGVLSSLTLVDGATNIRKVAGGAAFAFTSTSERIVLQYSTATCHDFYAGRGHLAPQWCSEPVVALSSFLPAFADVCP